MKNVRISLDYADLISVLESIAWSWDNEGKNSDGSSLLRELADRLKEDRTKPRGDDSSV